MCCGVSICTTDYLLKINEDSKKAEATVMPNDATGREGRTNQVDVAKRSYLDALTRARG